MNWLTIIEHVEEHKEPLSFNQLELLFPEIKGKNRGVLYRSMQEYNIRVQRVANEPLFTTYHGYCKITKKRRNVHFVFSTSEFVKAVVKKYPC